MGDHQPAHRNGLLMPEIPKIDIPFTVFSVPKRADGATAAKPVRAFVKDGVLIEEFEIVGGTREGEILTLKTKIKR